MCLDLTQCDITYIENINGIAELNNTWSETIPIFKIN